MVPAPLCGWGKPLMAALAYPLDVPLRVVLAEDNYRSGRSALTALGTKSLIL
jgi:hypothetical protein